MAAVYRAERAGMGSEAPGSWRRAADAWNWQTRAEAWDHQQAALRQERRLAELEEMHKRHLEVRLLMLSKAVAALERLDPGTLTPEQLMRLAENAIAGEERARAEPAVADLQRQVEQLVERLEGAR
jgi:hypothetical protein